MPLYFMHLRDISDEVLDPDGVRMPEEAIARAALLAARDCMAHDVQARRLDFKYRIDVHNEDGELVHTRHFSNAVEILPGTASSG
jgi:hypothetical protein